MASNILGERLRAWAQVYQLPNVALGVLDAQGVFRSFAASSSADCEPADPLALYPIYSIMKTFIACLLLQASEGGRLDLDAPAASVIADIPEGQRFSLRQMLNHSCGLGDYCRLASYHEGVAEHPRKPWTRAQYIERTYLGKLEFEPGQGWIYSNLAYLFLREVAEKVFAKPIGEILRERIFTPLGMKRSYQLVKAEDLLAMQPALSHYVSPGEDKIDLRGLYHPGWVGHGLVASTVEDISRFYAALGAGEVIDAESMRQMTQLRRVPGEHPPAVFPGYGLGIMCDPKSPLGPGLGHGGGGPGYVVRGMFWPEMRGGISATMFTTHEDLRIEPLMRELGDFLLANDEWRR